MYLRLMPAQNEPAEATRLRVEAALKEIDVAARVSPHAKGGFSVSFSGSANSIDLSSVLSRNGLIFVF